jgi:4-amino-4-deoxy-L-arabinose transferase-like glycosyltransferase
MARRVRCRTPGPPPEGLGVFGWTSSQDPLNQQPSNTNSSSESSTVLQALAEDSGEILAPRRVTVPPAPSYRPAIWAGLLGCVVVCLPLLLVGIFAGADVQSEAEAQALITSRETWRRYHAGIEDALWIPKANGVYQINPPPMTTWCHVVVWADLDPETVSTSTLVWRARVASVILVVIALIATYWAGLSIGDVRTARFAALCFGTTILTVTEAWAAWSGPLLLGFSALSVASGLWAMRPLKDASPAPRRVIGWLLSGVALGAAILTHGPGAMLFVLPPLIAAIALTSTRRFGNTLGLLFSVMVGLFSTAPWYLHVLSELPEAWNQLAIEHRAPQQLFILSWSHTRILVMLLPWLVWIIGGLWQPFVRADDPKRRRQLLIAWCWAVLTFIVLSVPSAEDTRYLLPILPAVALLVGQLWAYHVDMASERLEDPDINRLRVPHWLMIIGVSFFGSAYVAFQPELIEAGYLKQQAFPGLSRWVWLGVGGVLVVIAALGARWHFKWRVRSAAYATVAWTVVASTVGMWCYAHSHHHRYAHRAAAQAVALVSADRQLVYLHDSNQDRSLHPAFVFYADRPISPFAEDRLEQIRKQPERVIVIAHGPQQAARLVKLNFVSVEGFNTGFDDGRYSRRLFLSPAPTPTPSKVPSETKNQ